MGLLVKGSWQDRWYDTSQTGGRFVREDAQFRQTISADGPFLPASGRYHLWVSLACPWAHRTLIMRKLKGLEPHISLSIVHPDMLEQGWQFAGPELGSSAQVGDPLLGLQYMHQLYTQAEPDYSGRVTVPVLWDKQSGQIVNNESSEIVRIFNQAFNGLTGNDDDYYPEALRAEIDNVNELVYHQINNGVYKTGFATTQQAYEDAFGALFKALDQLEVRLQGQQWLLGEQLTEADIRLFTTLVRFDAVYYGHFKCNWRPIGQYRNLQRLLEQLYQWPGVAATTDMVHIKRHYYYSHDTINPSRVVPQGPHLPWLV